MQQTEKQGCQVCSAIAFVLCRQTHMSCKLAALSTVWRLAAVMRDSFWAERPPQEPR